MKRFLAGMAVVMGLGVGAGEAQAFSATYDQTVTQGSLVMKGKVAVKDEMFRMEATVEGQTMVSLRNASGTYTYLPNEHMAMKAPKLNLSQQPIQHADRYQDYLKERHARKIGSETIDGHPCDVYQFTDPSAPGMTTAWVWMEKSFPVKVEVDGPEGKAVVEMSNIQLGAAIPDDVFQVPPGVPVMDVGSMMNMQPR